MNNKENNNQNVNGNEQPVAAPVENNEKKSMFRTAWNVIKGTSGAVANAFKEHKTATAISAGVITVGMIALVVLKKKAKVDEPAADPDGFDNK